ncbi:MAG: PAS domain S-box protein [Bacteroidetes bacterium]|nr:PAS domain S-box protein [Bacteroidota bacterium]
MKILGILLILVFSHAIALPAGPQEWNGKRDSFLVADSLNNFAEIFMENYPEISKYYSENAFFLSSQINYIKGEVDALSSLSKYYLTRDDYIKTLEMYFKIIDISEHNHDIDNLVYGYSLVAQFFRLIKDYDLSEKYLVLLDKAAHKSLNTKIQAQGFLSYAQYYLAKSEYDLAIRNLYLCIPYFRKGCNPCSEGGVYKFLGDAYLQKKMYSQSEYNYRMAVDIFTKMPNPTELAILYTRIAHIHQVLNNNELNLKFNLAALRIRQQIGHSKLISSSFLNVGEAYWLLGRKDSASFYLKKSLQLAERIKDTYQLEVIYSQLSIFAKAENRYADALEYYKICMEHKTRLNLDRNRLEILTLEANRTIRAGEMQNDLLNQEILFQDLQIKNRRIQIFLYEVAFLIMLSLILFVDTLARRNRNRKNELKELNTRLTQEIDIRIEAEGRLNRSEELHRFLAENTVDVISLMDANMQRLYISPSCEKFYGYTAREILQMRSPLDLIEPTYHVTVNQHLLEMLRSKSSTRYIYKVLRKDGSTFWAEANINPIMNHATHDVKNLITVVRDISERMKHEEELSENSRQKEYLLREIHNRVKNNFAILVSLMNMQRDQSANPELSSSLTDLQLRVRTMSLVHEQLYQTQEISTIPFDNYLHHLALIISTSFNNNRIQLQTEIHPCNVAIEMALPLGLIINELITNAYKYAFPGDRTGKIWVRLLPENEDKFCISISDDGVGLPPDFTMNTTQSMGSQIVGILVEQIEAILEVSSNEGACFRILFSTAQEK